MTQFGGRDFILHNSNSPLSRKNGPVFPSSLHCLWTDPRLFFPFCASQKQAKGKTLPAVVSRSWDLWQALSPPVRMKLWPPELSKWFRSLWFFISVKWARSRGQSFISHSCWWLSRAEKSSQNSLSLGLPRGMGNRHFGCTVERQEEQVLLRLFRTNSNNKGCSPFLYKAAFPCLYILRCWAGMDKN